MIRRLGGMVIGGLLAVLAPAASYANSLLISNVSVTVGGTTWCVSGCAAVLGGGPIWTLPGGSVTVTSPDTAGPTKSLVLTQTALSPFNFDTSEPNGQACLSPGRVCTTSLSINGNVVAIGGAGVNILANNNGDTLGQHQEAANWSSVFDLGANSGSLRVWFGYADNAHSETPCADAPDRDCLPNDPWSGGGTNLFIGAATPAGLAGGCARPNTPSCFDAGAIRIELNDTPRVVPEPATLALLGAGLILLARRRRSQK